MHRICCSFLIGIGMLSAQTSLSGTIGGMTFDSTGNPYIISETVTVPANKKVRIEPGCVFLFKPYSGLIIEGSLTVGGTAEHPVVFTTVNDTRYNPDSKEPAKAFDWNGIVITPDAGEVALSHFILMYSVFGLKAQKESIVLNKGTFNANGQYQCTINDHIEPVIEGLPYTYRSSAASAKGVGTAETDIKNGQSGSLRKAAPMVVIGAGILTGVGTAISFGRMNSADNSYVHESDPVAQDQFLKQRSRALTMGAVLGGVTALCVPTGLILFVRNRSHTEKIAGVHVVPRIGMTNGVVMNVEW